VHFSHKQKKIGTYKGVKQSPSTAKPGGGRGRQKAICCCPFDSSQSAPKPTPQMSEEEEDQSFSQGSDPALKKFNCLFAESISKDTYIHTYIYLWRRRLTGGHPDFIKL
jgi:hypothetical protein